MGPFPEIGRRVHPPPPEKVFELLKPSTRLEIMKAHLTDICPKDIFDDQELHPTDHL